VGSQSPTNASSAEHSLPWFATSRVVIFVAAFLTRLGCAAYILSTYFGPQLLYLQNEPSHIAAALASGLGFSSPYANTPTTPTAQQPPLYPLLLAGVFKVFGIFTVRSAWTAVSINILAGAITAVLVYHVGRLHFSEKAGVFAAWLWVVPWGYRSTSLSVSLSNGSLAALGLTALFLWTPKTLSNRSRWFALGVYCGLLVLLQTSLLTVVVIYAGWLAVAKPGSTPMRWSRVGVAAAGILLALAPWSARNYSTFGRLIPIRDNFGLELWVGNRPGMHGTMDFEGDFPDHDPTNYVRLGELPFMDAKLDEARAFILRDPSAFGRRFLLRIVEFWYFPYPFSWIVFSIAGWLGAAAALWKDRRNWVWLAILAVFPVVYYITHNFASYRDPVQPLIILLAAYFTVEMIALARSSFSSSD
jgi:4-amino-4-deoxy-L-arabinose transferase-like glycosyltransferase